MLHAGGASPHSSGLTEQVAGPFADHLAGLSLGKERRVLDLLLHGNGHRMSIAWRLHTLIRGYFTRYNVLIPCRARGATALVAIGAETIVMGKRAELSLLHAPFAPGGTVGDIECFLEFVRGTAHTTDQASLSRSLDTLLQRSDPVAIGRIYRYNAYVRLLIRKLLEERRHSMDEMEIESVVETMTSRSYLASHSVGPTEAKSLGLRVTVAKDTLEDLAWALHTQYQDYLGRTDRAKSAMDRPVAVLESAEHLHVCTSEVADVGERSLTGSADSASTVSIPPRVEAPSLLNRALRAGDIPSMASLPQALGYDRQYTSFKPQSRHPRVSWRRLR